MHTSNSHPPSNTSAALPHTLRGRPRLDLRVALGLLLLLGGTAATVVLIRQAGDRTPVLIAARAVPPGQVVDASDVAVAELGLSPGVATLQPQDRDLVVGRIAAAPLAQGQVLHRGAVADALPLAAGEVAVSVPATPDRAVGGTVQPGQRVRLVAGLTVLAEQVRVLAVTEPERGLESEGSITLAVPAAQAPRVAAAAHDGGVDLLGLPGTAAGESSP